MAIKLGSLSELTKSRYVVHLSDGKRLVLFRLLSIESSHLKSNESPDGWIYYAMEAECPHAGGPMAESSVDIEDSAYVVSCPWHAYDFNVETGESSVGIKTCTYPIVIRGEVVYLNYVRDNGDVRMEKIEAVSEKVKLKSNKNLELPQTPQNGPNSPRYLGEKSTFCDWAVHILNTADPEHKIELTHHLFTIFTNGEDSSSPMELGRGAVAPLITHHRILSYGLSILPLTFALDLHHSGHSEIPESCRELFGDWLKVANDEAKHFSLLRARIEELGSHFGALPVHHGLWQSATETAHDIRARISIIALVHEARGLDVNPMTIRKFRKSGDIESVKALEVIHHDEITHVTTGHRWLTWICDQEGTDPVQVFHSNVRKHFKGSLRGPFNEEARLQAGMDERWYKDQIALDS